jgi:hypothetical protein
MNKLQLQSKQTKVFSEHFLKGVRTRLSLKIVVYYRYIQMFRMEASSSTAQPDPNLIWLWNRIWIQLRNADPYIQIQLLISKCRKPIFKSEEVIRENLKMNFTWIIVFLDENLIYFGEILSLLFLRSIFGLHFEFQKHFHKIRKIKITTPQ